MARISNVTSNGVIDSVLISRLIREINNINDWLNELGYEQPNQGMLFTANYARGDDTPATDKDIKGADDFKIFSASKGVLLKKDQTRHGTVKIPVNTGHRFNRAVVSMKSPEIPAFASVKSISGAEIVCDVVTIGKPTANTNARLMVIAVVADQDQDTD